MKTLLMRTLTTVAMVASAVMTPGWVMAAVGSQASLLQVGYQVMSLDGHSGVASLTWTSDVNANLYADGTDRDDAQTSNASGSGSFGALASLTAGSNPGATGASTSVNGSTIAVSGSVRAHTGAAGVVTEGNYWTYASAPSGDSFWLSARSSVTFSALARVSAHADLGGAPGTVGSEWATASASLWVDGAGVDGTGYQSSGDGITASVSMIAIDLYTRLLQVTFVNQTNALLKGSFTAEVSASGESKLMAPTGAVPESSTLALGLAGVLLTVLWRARKAACCMGTGLLIGAQAQAQTAVVPQISCAAVTTSTCAVAKALKRGVNFGNMLEASPTEGSWGVSVKPAYMDVAASAFNTIRLPVRWSNHAAPTVDGKLDEVFANRVDVIVDTLLSKGVYVILDFHHHMQIVGAKLHPGEFAVDERILDSRFINIWRQVAARYRNRSPKLVFEMLNEPTGRLTAERWNALAARTLPAIRATNPTRAVIIGVSNLGQGEAYDKLVMPNSDRNLILGAHSYEPVDFTIPNWATAGKITCCSDEQKALIRASLSKMVDYSMRSGYPVHLGEFGSNLLAPIAGREAYTRFVRDEAEARGMGWAYWEFASYFGVYPASTNTWLEPIRRALLD